MLYSYTTPESLLLALISALALDLYSLLTADQLAAVGNSIALLACYAIFQQWPLNSVLHLTLSWAVAEELPLRLEGESLSLLPSSTAHMSILACSHRPFEMTCKILH